MSTDFNADDLVADTTYERDVIFNSPKDDVVDAYERLVKVRSTSTHESGKTSSIEYLSIEHMRASTLGGYYVSEQFSVSLSSSRAERTELLVKFAASLGLDISID